MVALKIFHDRNAQNPIEGKYDSTRHDPEHILYAKFQALRKAGAGAGTGGRRRTSIYEK